MTDKPLCPDCGRPLVWLSSPEVWKCFKCQKPPEPSWAPWWMWILLIVIMAFMFALMILLPFPPAHNGSGNLTQAADQVELSRGLAWFVVILLLGMGVGYAMERGKERCPACGEVLRLVHEVQKYKCLHCGSWYPREDIEVEVVD